MAGKGGRGRTPTPTKLKLVKGERKDRINTAEPVPATGEIVPPYKLVRAVQEVWDRLAPDRIRTGVLTVWDVDAFALFCELLVANREATKLMHRGILVKGARQNEPVYNRAMQGVRETSQLLVSLGSRFGWTPSDRAQLSLKEESDDREAAELLS
jgi:P27 family predicted phage terminase small subunit